ncbi:MAG: response regulator [Anaerolineales bacterium]|nr:response regulator [Anaerolineales bacterium]
MNSDSSQRILIVDDDLAIRRFLRTSLVAQGYTVSETNSGEGALLDVINKRPDLVILDIGLPDMDGIEVTRSVRQWTKIPIIILSVLDQEKEKIAALDAGADDYLTKPFSIGELTARMRVAFRHATLPVNMPNFESGALEVDLARRIVTVRGKEISLTPTEYELLRILIQDAGKVLTHQQIIRTLWGDIYQPEMHHLLRVNISNLRKKIEPDASRPKYIFTEPGIGYRLKLVDK